MYIKPIILHYRRLAALKLLSAGGCPARVDRARCVRTGCIIGDAATRNFGACAREEALWSFGALHWRLDVTAWAAPKADHSHNASRVTLRGDRSYSECLAPRARAGQPPRC